MKSPLLFLFLTGLIVSCHAQKLSSSGTKERAMVESFIQLMINDYNPDYDEMLTYLAPSYIKTHNIDTSQYRVNNYGVHGFHFVSWDQKTGIIIFNIWGKDKFWTHEIHFQVVKEKRKLWIMPGKHEDNWIDPWIKVKTYI